MTVYIDSEPVWLIIEGRLVVYISEEGCAHLVDLVEFVREHEAEFLDWRQRWGDGHFLTREAQ